MSSDLIVKNKEQEVIIHALASQLVSTQELVKTLQAAAPVAPAAIIPADFIENFAKTINDLETAYATVNQLNREKITHDAKYHTMLQENLYLKKELEFERTKVKEMLDARQDLLANDQTAGLRNRITELEGLVAEQEVTIDIKDGKRISSETERDRLAINVKELEEVIVKLMTIAQDRQVSLRKAEADRNQALKDLEDERTKKHHTNDVTYNQVNFTEIMKHLSQQRQDKMIEVEKQYHGVNDKKEAK
jgi:riboflavin synthase